MDDPRLTPARGDLAAKYLEGKVKAKRFVTGEEFEIADALAALRATPACDASLLTQALKGERVTIYDRNGEGFAWGQLARRRLCRLAARRRAGKTVCRANAQNHRTADLCVSRTVDQAAAGRDAPARGQSRYRARRRRLRGDARRLVSAALPCRPDRRDRERFRRGRRTLRRHALSVGRQEQPWHRLLRAWCRSR